VAREETVEREREEEEAVEAEEGGSHLGVWAADCDEAAPGGSLGDGPHDG
tara:strand:- start:174 stop:323 length:150 start_codon:yes stop_codon:yes gene_type:complete